MLERQYSSDGSTLQTDLTDRDKPLHGITFLMNSNLTLRSFLARSTGPKNGTAVHLGQTKDQAMVDGLQFVFSTKELVMEEKDTSRRIRTKKLTESSATLSGCENT